MKFIIDHNNNTLKECKEKEKWCLIIFNENQKDLNNFNNTIPYYFDSEDELLEILKEEVLSTLIGFNQTVIIKKITIFE